MRSDKEFKVAIIRNAGSDKKTQKGWPMNSGIKLMAIRDSLPKKMIFFFFCRNQTEIPELRKTGNEMKNSLDMRL